MELELKLKMQSCRNYIHRPARGVVTGVNYGLPIDAQTECVMELQAVVNFADLFGTVG